MSTSYLVILWYLYSLHQAMDNQPVVNAELDQDNDLRSRLLTERRSRRNASNRDYGATEDCVVINVKNNTNIYNERKQSICGSHNGTLKVSRDVFEHIWKFIQNDEDKRSVSRSNHALDIHRLSVDASFQRVFESLLTSELQSKLNQAPVFRQVANDTVAILQRNRTLKLLEHERFKFIRGIDESDRPFIVFSLSPSNDEIPYHFEQRQNILITFNETNIHSSTRQFTMDEFIHLIKYDNVLTSLQLGIDNETNHEWIHYSDFISTKQRIARNHHILFMSFCWCWLCLFFCTEYALMVTIWNIFCIWIWILATAE